MKFKGVGIMIVVALVVLAAQAWSGPDGEEGKEAPAKAAPKPKTQADAHYVGSKKCKTCHIKQHKTWKKMKHANAWGMLPEEYRNVDAAEEVNPKSKDKRPGRKCVACHTTGFGEGEKGGFRKELQGDPIKTKSGKRIPSMKGVQCEACHGPGSLHLAPAKLAMRRKPKGFAEGEDPFITLKVTNCTKCHNPHVSHAQYKPKPADAKKK